MAFREPRKSRPKPTTHAARQRRLKEVATDKRIILLIRAGADTYQIAEDLGLTHRAARDRIMRMWERNRPPQLQVTSARYKIEDRYEALWRIAWPKAVAAQPDIKWFRECIRILSDLRAMYGADQPIQHRHGGAPGAAPIPVQVVDFSVLAELTDDELEQEAKRVAAFAQSVAVAGSIARGPDRAGEAPAYQGEDGGGPG